MCQACAVGAFNRAAGAACESCPADFDCVTPGMALEKLPLAKGFMRMRATSDVALPCADGPSGASCPEAADKTGSAGETRIGCDPEGHSEGPRCALCEGGHFWDGDAAACEECEGTLDSASPVTVLSIVLLVLAFAALIYVLVAMATSTSGDVKTAGKMGRLRNKQASPGVQKAGAAANGAPAPRGAGGRPSVGGAGT